MNISVVHSHSDFIVVNKPAGISVQNEQRQSGLLPLLRQQQNIDQLWLVHRLDKVTSGLLLLATNQAAASSLSQAFAQRQVGKFYLALVSKKPNKKQGLISGDMKKVRDGKWMLQSSQTNPAITQFFSCGLQAGKRLVILKPHTGKTHQLRVALKSLGSPILGDTSYAAEPADRTYLHAYTLKFNYAGQNYHFKALPEQGEWFQDAAFAQALLSYQQPESLPWPRLPNRLQQPSERNT